MRQFLFMGFLSLFCTKNTNAQTNFFTKNILFESGKAKLTISATQELTEISDSLKKMQYESIELRGNTDAEGSANFNKNLSEKRVEAVKQFLINKGISAEKINSIADGEEKPVAQNNTNMGKQQNRRVEILVKIPPPSVSQQKQATESGKNFHIMRVYKELVTPSERISFTLNRDTIIKGKKGTQIIITADAFLGVKKGDKIDIELKECYSFGDILANNLTTMAGEALMQTGGMIYVNATANGKDLKLQKPLSVLFNSKESLMNGMKTFIGERKMERGGSMFWSAMPSVTPKNGDNFVTQIKPTFYIDYAVKKRRVYTLAPLSVVLDTIETDSLFEPFVIYAKTVFGAKERQRSFLYTPYSMGTFVLENMDFRYLPTLKIHRAAFDDVYTFYKVNSFEELQKQDPTAWDNVYKSRADSVKIVLEKELIEKKRIRDSTTAAIVREQAKQDSIERVKYPMRFLSTEALSITQFGWINCDRFISFPQNSLTEIQVYNIQKGNNIDLKLILPKIKSIISPYIINNTANFGKIPKNEPAMVFALKTENGKTFMALQDYDYTKENNLIFKETTSENVLKTITSLK